MLDFPGLLDLFDFPWSADFAAFLDVTDVADLAGPLDAVVALSGVRAALSGAGAALDVRAVLGAA